MTIDEVVIERNVELLKARFLHVGLKGFHLEKEKCYREDIITGRALSKEEQEEITRRLLYVIEHKVAKDSAVLIPVSTVYDPKLHEEWYDEWLKDNSGSQYYWPRLEKYLGDVLTSHWGAAKSGRIVRSIDSASHDIMCKVADPRRGNFDYKGLVVGYVQSGKTANFTALIARAADAGYKLIIVLAGIHDVLRQQTQLRLDKELTGINDIPIKDKFIDRTSDARAWERLTTYDAEFSSFSKDPFESYCDRNRPVLVVIKKNVRVLSNLISYLGKAASAQRAKVPVLLIDDEADQASVDTNANKDVDPTRTNEAIRKLLKLFPRKVYVGYTATPFANVLINMKAVHSSLKDDLYPRNFVCSLPLPEDYFGTQTIFNKRMAKWFIREIENEKSALLRGGKITANLEQAINEFLVSCTIRTLRSDSEKPMSMLVHVSEKIEHMGAINAHVTAALDLLKTKLSDKSGRTALKKEYHALWQNTRQRAAKIGHALKKSNFQPSFEQIWKNMPEVVKQIEIVELNTKSEDKLDYSKRRNIKVIAIGGNQLSRGLTLEGLMTSYYLRNSKQYDTLLQMGRWFGYKNGYEDLIRIYTTSSIWESFEHLALVEGEIRDEIARYYEDGNKTPADLAIAIRTHKSLKVTAPDKMGAAAPRQTTYSKSLNQTFRFPLKEPEVLKKNLRLGEAFIKKINKDVGFELKGDVYLAKKPFPPKTVLKDFIEKYEFNDDSKYGAGLDRKQFLEYIKRRVADGELRKWRIGVVTNAIDRAKPNHVTFGGLPVNMIQRSRKTEDSGYNIGVLTEANHLVADLPSKKARDPYEGRSSDEPLLLLYRIWKDSVANKKTGREDLYQGLTCEKVDLLGLAVVLPHSAKEPDNYIGQ